MQHQSTSFNVLFNFLWFKFSGILCTVSVLRFFLIGYLKSFPVVNSRNDGTFLNLFFFPPIFLVRMSSSDFLDLKITFEEDIWES